MTTETITHTGILETLETIAFPNIPPFPSDIPTAPLYRLSLSALRSNPAESARLFQSSKDLDFFYLDLRGDVEGERLLEEADQAFELAQTCYDLGRDDRGSYMGYKGSGTSIVDEKGNLDRNEFYNVRTTQVPGLTEVKSADSRNIPKDEFLGISETPFEHPQLFYKNADLINSYIQTAHSIVILILSHLNNHLHLPPNTLQNLHYLRSHSGDQVCLIKSTPQPASELRTTLGNHTDFGSLTIIFNRLGGLQILPPSSLTPADQEPQWIYVKPLPGHCIVNLGDAMVKFMNGLLRSNIHRVVAPPGVQGQEIRYSVVYFARPGDEVVLKRLEGSDVIPELKEGEKEEENDSKDWILLQALRLREVKDGMSDGEKKKLWEESGRGK
ncbi:Oxidoreductase [Lachnellula hyalina]|uniref:Oxidoreductase n=1 Tax=Lachnellula hyalina TaxID=1316788 RepID=A0A8H8R4X8_9HELO|nr:Oxidoreductase [Lachnellula hyalina]TVY28518.1 Oxidoreductase [Lachnellula hyalina]